MTRVVAARFTYDFPYASRRAPVFARRAIATSHPLASQAGLAVLASGGNAVEAAIAAAATLTVVEPTMNGLGSDLFAMVWDGSRLHGLNASGRSPRSLSASRFAGRTLMPELGWDAVTVPGAVSGWVALWERFGERPFESLLEPAIGYATNGFHVTPHVGTLWADAPARFRNFGEFARVFLQDGRAPEVGELVRLPEHAESLAAIAGSRGAAFYRGHLAERIAATASAAGAALALSDLEGHEASWVEPLSVEFASHRVHELPPNGQGLAALIALGILRELRLPSDPDSPDSIHLQVEVMKRALADSAAHVADPARMRVTTEELLDPVRLSRLSRDIRVDRAAPPAGQPPADHGTVYLSVGDAEGRMVSLIQSNYLGFGSGVVIPGTGIALQNRGRGFSLDPSHPNAVQGGVRPFHTIMPGFVTTNGEPFMSFGVMGGHMQPQGHLQMAVRTLFYRQNPQAASDAPRFRVTEAHELALEPGFSPAVARELESRGHRVVFEKNSIDFGGAQAVARIPGGYCAASDHRKDGQAAGI